jgi:Kef-type K+ transport system membrane component KefB
MKFDLDTLVSSVGAMLKVPLFLGMFLLVRGVPVLVLYRHIMVARDRMALALLSATELPLVVAITTLAVGTGHMRTSTSAALVGAAMISTLVFPLAGLRLRQPEAEPGDSPAAAMG